jgi:hypothetical protein
MVKLKITRPDGTVVEIEASAADINAMASTLGLTWITNLTTQFPTVVAGGGVGTFFGPKY